MGKALELWQLKRLIWKTSTSFTYWSLWKHHLLILRVINETWNIIYCKIIWKVNDILGHKELFIKSERLWSFNLLKSRNLVLRIKKIYPYYVRSYCYRLENLLRIKITTSFGQLWKVKVVRLRKWYWRGEK